MFSFSRWNITLKFNSPFFSKITSSYFQKFVPNIILDKEDSISSALVEYMTLFEHISYPQKGDLALCKYPGRITWRMCEQFWVFSVSNFVVSVLIVICVFWARIVSTEHKSFYCLMSYNMGTLELQPLQSLTRVTFCYCPHQDPPFLLLHAWTKKKRVLFDQFI